MSITDELRTGGIYRFPSNRRVFTEEELTAIADRIDIAHKHAIGYVDDRDPETMAESGWIRLPLDANGDVLHIGELVDEELPFGGYAPPAPIDTMELSRGASGYGWMVKLDAENRALVSPKLLRHHRAPTVEDVLREFAEKMAENTAMYVAESWDADERDEADAAAIAEYAAKLRLVEGVDA